MMQHYFIVRCLRPDGLLDYICAPPGWYWTEEGVKQEPPGFRSAGAEHTPHAGRAFKFRSHRAAARVANTCGPTTIIEISSPEPLPAGSFTVAVSKSDNVETICVSPQAKGGE